MLVRLHSEATTTPKVRAEIQASTDPAWMLAERYGVTEQTVYKWRHRDSVVDRSHTPHRLQTTLSSAQEAIVVIKVSDLDPSKSNVQGQGSTICTLL